MRRRSVTEDREPASASPAGADIAGRIPDIAGRIHRCQGKRTIAVDGGWADDGHVGDEYQAVVTWR